MAPHPSPDDHSLPKERILSGQKNFNRLFENNGVKVFHGRYVSFRFRIYPGKPEYGCKVGFIVKRTLAKATVRNRTKRLMREAYRRQQHQLCALIDENNAGIHGALMAKTVDIDYQNVMDDITDLLTKTRNFIHSSSIVN